MNVPILTNVPSFYFDVFYCHVQLQCQAFKVCRFCAYLRIVFETENNPSNMSGLLCVKAFSMTLDGFSYDYHRIAMVILHPQTPPPFPKCTSAFVSQWS